MDSDKWDALVNELTDAAVVAEELIEERGFYNTFIIGDNKLPLLPTNVITAYADAIGDTKFVPFNALPQFERWYNTMGPDERQRYQDRYVYYETPDGGTDEEKCKQISTVADARNKFHKLYEEIREHEENKNDSKIMQYIDVMFNEETKKGFANYLKWLGSFFASGKFITYGKRYIKSGSYAFDPLLGKFVGINDAGIVDEVYNGNLTDHDLYNALEGGDKLYCIICNDLANCINPKSFKAADGTDLFQYLL